MRQQTFGCTGEQVSVIGQGTWYLDRGDRNRAVAALRRVAIAPDRGLPIVPETAQSRSISNPKGADALRGVGAAEIVNRGWSDHQGQLVEGSQDP